MDHGKFAPMPTCVVVDATGCWVKGGIPTSAKGETARSVGPPTGAPAAGGAEPREEEARPPSTDGGAGSSATDGTGISKDTASVAARKASRTDGATAEGVVISFPYAVTAIPGATTTPGPPDPGSAPTESPVSTPAPDPVSVSTGTFEPRFGVTTTSPSRPITSVKGTPLRIPVSIRNTVPRAAATAVGVCTSNFAFPTTAFIFPSRRLKIDLPPFSLLYTYSLTTTFVFSPSVRTESSMKSIFAFAASRVATVSTSRTSSFNFAGRSSLSLSMNVFPLTATIVLTASPAA